MKRYALSLSLIALTAACSPPDSVKPAPTSAPDPTPPPVPPSPVPPPAPTTTPLAATCETDADCNTVTCAPDAFCNYAKVCTRLAQDNLCGTGAICVLADTVEASGCQVPPRCGDGKCNGTEDYVSCLADCPAPPVPPKPECVVDNDCDDGLGCTANACVDGKCQYAADSSVCAAFEAGATCIVGKTILLPVKAAPTGCYSQLNESTSAAICDDSVACTYDAMKSNMQCAHIVQDSKCEAGYHCDASQGCVRNAPVCTMPEPLPCAKDECTYDGVKRTSTCGANAICIKTGCQANVTACPAGLNCVAPAVITPPPPASTPTPAGADDLTIACVAQADGTIGITLQGNLKSGLVKVPDHAPIWIGYGADSGAYGWPTATGPDARTNVGSVVIAADGSWTVPAFSLSSATQGFNFYAVADGAAVWFKLDAWKIQGCTKVETKLYSNK